MSDPAVTGDQTRRPDDVLKALGTPPKLRYYAWALSGEFSAKLELFGEAQTADDLDALADYVELTVKALKRSLLGSGGVPDDQAAERREQ